MNCFVQVWRDYEPRTMPVLVINLILPPHYYDINLSTDKKQILLFKEDVLMAAFQEIFRAAVDASNANIEIVSSLAASTNGADHGKRSKTKSIQSTTIGEVFGGVQQRKMKEEGEKEKEKEKRMDDEDGCVEIPPSLSTPSSFPAASVTPSIPVHPPDANPLPPSPSFRVETIPIPSNPTLIDVASIPVVVDRCRKSKKRRDPLPDTPLTLFASPTSGSSPSSSAIPSSHSTESVNCEGINKHNYGDDNVQNGEMMPMPMPMPKRRDVHDINESNCLSIPSSLPSQPSQPSQPSSMSSILTMIPSNDCSQPSNISHQSILSQFNSLLQSKPSILQETIASSSDFHPIRTNANANTNTNENNSGEEGKVEVDAPTARAEEELTRVLHKVLHGKLQ